MLTKVHQSRRDLVCRHHSCRHNCTPLVLQSPNEKKDSQTVEHSGQIGENSVNPKQSHMVARSQK